MDRVALLHVALLLILSAWVAWRYSHQPLDPDRGHYLHWGFAGGIPYRDFLDPKPPGIHVWFKLLGLATRRHVELAIFIHHMVVGIGVVTFYLITRSLGGALLALTLLQSAWLYAYQSLSDAMSALLLLLALVLPAWPSLICLGLALVFNLKIGPPGLVLLLARGQWVPLAAALVVAALVVGIWLWRWPRGFRTVWYSIITIPYRMATEYRNLSLVRTWPRFFSTHLLFILPAILIALWIGWWRWELWALIVAYVITNSRGRTWLPNHSLPLAIVAVTQPPTELAAALLVVDWFSARFYIGNIWAITYDAGFAQQLDQARLLGDALRQSGARIWVNTFHTQLYIYAGQPCRWGMFEMLESAPVARERALIRDQRLRANPPDLIVIGPGMVYPKQTTYQVRAEFGFFKVLA